MNLANRIAFEKRIARMIVKDAIAMGYGVSLHNGGDENEITNSTDRNAINDLLCATDEENIIFVKDGRTIGAVFMVYGNDGWDVMCDWTDKPEVNAILANAQAACDKKEKEEA